jgi:hypothetical protein
VEIGQILHPVKSLMGCALNEKDADSTWNWAGLRGERLEEALKAEMVWMVDHEPVKVIDFGTSGTLKVRLMRTAEICWIARPALQ